jgi:(p)ppGpp synthase/HD superfamily hydrolase
MPALQDQYRPLLEAVAFAARAHHGQLRKDGRTPYSSHVFRVCLVVRHVFGIDDPAVLTAALLHDTIEDTTTDFDDLREQFGAEVASWVAALSKDKRLPEEQREPAYEEQFRRAPWQVQVCKLADIFDNLTDSFHNKAKPAGHTFERARHYLAALRGDLPEQARRPFEIVSGLLAELEAGRAK